MSSFIFITKTNWHEPPRMRHQLAWLLANAGHDVVFLEKPSYLWSRLKTPVRVHERITVVGYHEFIHHKLRLFPILHRLNAIIVTRSITSSLTTIELNSRPTIVNFNYEYYFIRRLFPGRKIITIINDDHTATALFSFRRPLEWALSRTCIASDKVLAVSVPLLKKLAEHCKAELFLPWSDKLYQSPSQTSRKVLLFWGYINNRLDQELLEGLADYLRLKFPQLCIWFIGPMGKDVKNKFLPLFERQNVEVKLATPLDDLPLDQILAGLIPYRTGNDKINAIELSNKALQLLARGFPLIISGMPNFVDKEFVIRIDRNHESYQKAIETVNSRFYSMQTSIREFVLENSPSTRLQQIMDFIC